MRSIILVVCILLITMPSQVGAASKIARFKDWEVYRHKASSGGWACVASSQPKLTGPRDFRSSSVYFEITTFRNGPKEQVSFVTNTALRPTKPAFVKFGSRKTRMAPHGNRAFVTNRYQESSVVSQIKKGSRMNVDYVTRNNVRVTHQFSLKGSSAAIKRANALCGR